MKRADRFGLSAAVRCAPARWSRASVARFRGPCRVESALRLRAARPRRLVVRACRRRPIVRAPGLHKEAEALRGSWSVVLSARSCCGLLRGPRPGFALALRASAPWFSAAGSVVGLGVSFLKRSLRARPAPAAVSFVVAAVTALAFLRSRQTALCFAAPASLGERRSQQSAVQSNERWEDRPESVKGMARPGWGQSTWPWCGQRERS